MVRLSCEAIGWTSAGALGVEGGRGVAAGCAMKGRRVMRWRTMRSGVMLRNIHPQTVAFARASRRGLRRLHLATASHHLAGEADANGSFVRTGTLRDGSADSIDTVTADDGSGAAACRAETISASLSLPLDGVGHESDDAGE